MGKSRLQCSDCSDESAGLCMAPDFRLQQVMIVPEGLWASSKQADQRISCLHSCHLVVQFLGGTNMLTGHTDEHWKTVRKAVAPAFSAGNMR